LTRGASPGAQPQHPHGRRLWFAMMLAILCAVLLALPAPEGLPEPGKRVIAVAVLAIGLWCSEALPAGVTGLLLVLALVVTGAVPGFGEALAGFSEPVAYFLIGVLTIGLAVSRSGLAERVARYYLRRSQGRPRSLYWQLLLSFPLLTLILPSATTRTGILVHVYEQALDMAKVPRRSSLAGAIMMALNSINRLASTVLLTGGITPVVAASLIGGILWSEWLLLMSVPYLVLLAIGAASIRVIYRRGFDSPLAPLPAEPRSPLSAREMRTILITLGASSLWLTDAIHHWNPAVPALLAWILLLSPRIGVLSWREFEREIGWTSFFVLASSLSLAKALIASGASAWVAGLIVAQLPQVRDAPLLLLALLMAACVPVRVLIPNITGYLATTIPIAMSVGALAGVNPVICGLAAMIAGDAVLYYPAQSASSLAVYERGYLSAPEILRFGIWMTVVAFLVVLAVAVPWWGAVGEPLRVP
jgi:anion transporter